MDEFTDISLDPFFIHWLRYLAEEEFGLVRKLFMWLKIPGNGRRNFGPGKQKN